MKTSCESKPSSCLPLRKFMPLTTLVRSIGRILPVLTGIAIVQLSMMINAAAASPDGHYQFVSASGNLKIGGETVSLQEDTFGGFGALKNGTATISNHRVRLYRKEASAMLGELFSSYGLSVNITGPSSISLKKKGKSFTGSSRPFVVSISGKFEGEKISGEMKWSYNVVVKDGKLIATAPISGSIEGMKVSGTIDITCRK